jgi:hypothetical protein
LLRADCAAEDRLRMRKLIALAAIILLSACRVSVEPLYGVDVTCTDSYGHRNSSSSCTTTITTPAVAVIAIQPTLVYADAADNFCFQFSPLPASVRVGGNYYFQNNTNSAVTIVGANQIPIVTVGPGQTSPSINTSGAGVYAFGIQGCRGVAGTAYYGVLNVTLN